jgi:repressor LexA
MLTKQQQATLTFIQGYFAKHQLAPTTAEIAEGLGIQSRGVVHRYLKALAQAGYLRLLPKRHRNIELLPHQLTPTLPIQELPIMGAIAAGRPIEAILDHDPINLADLFLGENRYALRVKGDSMIEDGIFDGDIVVCEQAKTAQSGQIVVALIDDNEATLKRFFPDASGRYVTLKPANAKLKPMRYAAERLRIQGVYIGLLRLSS